MATGKKKSATQKAHSAPNDDIRVGQLAETGRARGAVARELLEKDCQVACYLGHIALECAMKERAMLKARVTSKSEYAARCGQDMTDALFTGRRGHDLSHLADCIALTRLLTAERKADLIRSDVWRNMTSGARPYSLRYGTEKIDKRAAGKEIELGEILRRILELAP